MSAQASFWICMGLIVWDRAVRPPPSQQSFQLEVTVDAHVSLPNASHAISVSTSNSTLDAHVSLPNASSTIPASTSDGTVSHSSLQQAWYDECDAEFRTFNEPDTLSNWKLVDLKNGMCMVHHECAWEHCCIPKDFESKLKASHRNVYTTFCPWRTSTTETKRVETIDGVLPIPTNLPKVVHFPKNIPEMFAALNSAMQTKTKISVKTSGHSYSGSSQAKDSILINLHQWPKYASNGGAPFFRHKAAEVSAGVPTGVVLCQESKQPPVPFSLQHACRYARARGRPAILRVGGGEHFAEVFKALLRHNYGKEEREQLVMTTGMSATVGAAGGWLQGGGLPMNAFGRMYGFGCDNVLQLEMVLLQQRGPLHVRFGVQRWSDEHIRTLNVFSDFQGESKKDTYFVPETLEINGECNLNPVIDESEWRWGPCDELSSNMGREGPKKLFENLWFAVRGGGGGAYGVVTAAVYQLHPNPGPTGKLMAPHDQKGIDIRIKAESFLANESRTSAETMTEIEKDPLSDAANTLAQEYIHAGFQFWLQFVNGDSLRATASQGNFHGCSEPMGDRTINCFGREATNAFQEAWHQFLEKYEPVDMKPEHSRLVKKFLATLPNWKVHEWRHAHQIDDALKFENTPNPYMYTEDELKIWDTDALRDQALTGEGNMMGGDSPPTRMRGNGAGGTRSDSLGEVFGLGPVSAQLVPGGWLDTPAKQNWFAQLVEKKASFLGFSYSFGYGSAAQLLFGAHEGLDRSGVSRRQRDAAALMIVPPEMVNLILAHNLWKYMDSGNQARLLERMRGEALKDERGFVRENLVNHYIELTKEDLETREYPGSGGSYNHILAEDFGPLKDNWLEPCPADWTPELRREKCISPVEATWGTKMLKALEKVKDEADPHQLFQCWNCVGSVRVSAPD